VVGLLRLAVGFGHAAPAFFLGYLIAYAESGILYSTIAAPNWEGSPHSVRSGRTAAYHSFGLPPRQNCTNFSETVHGEGPTFAARMLISRAGADRAAKTGTRRPAEREGEQKLLDRLLLLGVLLMGLAALDPSHFSG